MSSLFLSYLVTSKNEGMQLDSLLSVLSKYRDVAECIILDDFSDEPTTVSILDTYAKDNFFNVYKHNLNNNYGEHKNYGKSYCHGKNIFQIDADEIPSEELLLNLRDIIESNPDTDLFWIPRINKFEGITDEDAKRWGWDISNPGKWVNWSTTGDYQTRIFKNLPSIKWEKKLHERIVGHKSYVFLPKEERFALIHSKTMAKQNATNVRYARDFTENENRGL